MAIAHYVRNIYKYKKLCPKLEKLECKMEYSNSLGNLIKNLKYECAATNIRFLT